MNKIISLSSFALLSFSVFADDNVDPDLLNNPIAVTEDTYSVSFEGIWDDIDIYTLQADGTMGLGKYFGATLGANALYADSDYGSENIQNVRAAAFARNPAIGRIELSYQSLFSSGENEDFFGITGEYYFKSWTLGAYFLSDDLSELDDLNIYSNIYVTDQVRIELDLLDASDNSALKGTLQFQLTEILGNDWLLGVSYGEDFFGEDQFGLSVKYVPNYTGTLKEYYRNYSTNIKSAFFN